MEQKSGRQVEAIRDDLSDAAAGGKVQCKQRDRAWCGCGWDRMGSNHRQSPSIPLSDHAELSYCRESITFKVVTRPD